MTNITKEEFYRAAEDRSQLEAFIEKVIDNLPLVIDLKGYTLDDQWHIEDPEIVAALNDAKDLLKPVYITNYIDSWNYWRGPVLLSYDADSGMFYALFTNSSMTLNARMSFEQFGESEWLLSMMES